MPVVPDIALSAPPADAGNPDEPVLDRPLFRQGHLSGADEASSPIQGTGSRFFLLESDEDLRRLLNAPLATWLVFLHPSQQRLATGSFRGPLKITGSAGTGKTVVALHRTRHLAAQGRRVFLTSYVTTLCHILERNLGLLCSPEERARITVGTIHSRAWAIVEAAGERVGLPKDGEIRALIEQACRRHACPLDVDLLATEWDAVVQAQGITSWDAYRTASRAGRGIPLSVRQRKAVWEVVEDVRAGLQHRGLMDTPDLCRRARELLQAGATPRPFDAVIVDEVQDLEPQELLLLAALASAGPDCLTLVGDGGQRIYGRPISFKALGIDVRGRSHVLRLNYRTTEQIRRFAERILRDAADDLDGGRDDRRAVRSLIGGPQPTTRGFSTPDEQTQFVVGRVDQHLAEGLQPEDMAIFAPRKDLLEPIKAALRAAGHHYHILSATNGEASGINLGTMHRAKGLEFKVVFVIDVSDGHVPHPRAYRGLKDPQAREEALQREMQLLYVSVTRARDEVYLTWDGKPSRFLEGGTGECNTPLRSA